MSDRVRLWCWLHVMDIAARLFGFSSGVWLWALDHAAAATKYDDSDEEVPIGDGQPPF